MSPEAPSQPLPCADDLVRGRSLGRRSLAAELGREAASLHQHPVPCRLWGGSLSLTVQAICFRCRSQNAVSAKQVGSRASALVTWACRNLRLGWGLGGGGGGELTPPESPSLAVLEATSLKPSAGLVPLQFPGRFGLSPVLPQLLVATSRPGLGGSLL